MSGTVIRRARREDVPDITRIYNHAIEHTTTTFDMDPKTIQERCQWFERYTDDYPLFVATSDARVVAWASIHPFGTRPAYRYTVEDTIYVDYDFHSQGIGSGLLSTLIDSARSKSYHTILGLIVGGNEASERLHTKFGFEQVGIMREVGRKFDQWLDILIYEKIIGPTNPDQVKQ